MKNLTIAIVLLFVLASFTTNLKNTHVRVLDDIDGTLLETNPIIENDNGNYTVTFDVDESVIVSSSLIGVSNEIYLIENGGSKKTKTVTLALEGINGRVATAFNNIYDCNYDVATVDALMNTQLPDRRPSGVVMWD